MLFSNASLYLCVTKAENMKKLKNKAAQFLSENGFEQLAKDCKKAKDAKEVLACVETGSKWLYNSTSNPKYKADLKRAFDLFAATIKVLA